MSKYESIEIQTNEEKHPYFNEKLDNLHISRTKNSQIPILVLNSTWC